MTEEETMLVKWFTNNLPMLVEYYNTLHIFNLVNMQLLASQCQKHILIPESWPIKTQWSFELLAASISGCLNNPDMNKRWEDWYKN